MPRKKKVRTGFYKLIIPEGAPEIIATIVAEDESYHEKELWVIKHLFVLHSLITRSHSSNIDLVRVSIKVESKRIKCSNANCSKIYRNLRDLGLIIQSRKDFKLGKVSCSYKIVDCKFTEYKVDRAKITKNLDLMLSGETNRGETRPDKSVASKNDFGDYRQVLAKIRFTPEFLKAYEKLKGESDVGEVCNDHEHTWTTQKHKEISGNPLHDTFVPGFITPLEAFAIQEIIDGKIRINQGAKGHRIYTNFTDLPRKFRPYLLLDGKPLIEIDIRNSQPLLAAILFRRYSENEYGFIKPDVLLYQGSCEIGLFYEHFMDINNIPDPERSNVKKKFFGQVFYGMEYENRDELKVRFINCYPTCYEAIFAIKGGRFYSKYYNEFSILMQQVEASIILAANFEMIEQGIDCYNIFDALYVTSEEDAEKACELLKQKFKDFGLTPSLRISRITQ